MNYLSTSEHSGDIIEGEVPEQQHAGEARLVQLPLQSLLKLPERDTPPAQPPEPGAGDTCPCVVTSSGLGNAAATAAETIEKQGCRHSPWYQMTPFRVIFSRGWIMAFQRTECSWGPKPGPCNLQQEDSP